MTDLPTQEMIEAWFDDVRLQPAVTNEPTAIVTLAEVKDLARSLAMQSAAPSRVVVDEIAEERARQIAVEGWLPAHDDAHDDSELADAAACYAMMARPDSQEVMDDILSRLWPWSKDWWKPGPTRRRQLIKAGALIVAEIERLDRAAPGEILAAMGRQL